MEMLKIVLFSILCAVTYGIVHDQITAHVSVEYFSIAHPPVFPTESPFWLAIGWGIITTWWVGLILGVILAFCARIGAKPKRDLLELRPSIIGLMLVSFVLAMSAGLLGSLLSRSGAIELLIWTDQIEPNRHSRFLFALWAHTASYLVGGVGGLFIAGRTLLLRNKMAQAASASSINSG